MLLDRPRRAARKAVDGFSRESELGWRWGRNAGPTLRFRTDGGDTALTEAGRAVVADLRRDGVALTTASALLGSDDLVDQVRAHVERLVDRQRVEIDEQAAALRGASADDAGKTYLVELLGPMPAVCRDDPLAQFVAHPRVRGVAEAYSRMRLRVYDYNAWLNLASPGDATQSQKWHRDLPEDHDIVKVFLYVRDVPEGAGPLSYVAGTHTAEGRRLRLPETWDGIGFRVDDTDVDRALAGARVVTAPGPAGTVVFADTRGLHRGGWARDTDRLVALGLYASRSCNRPGSLVPARGDERAALAHDFAVLPPDVAAVRARALGVHLDALTR